MKQNVISLINSEIFRGASPGIEPARICLRDHRSSPDQDHRSIITIAFFFVQFEIKLRLISQTFSLTSLLHFLRKGSSVGHDLVESVVPSTVGLRKGLSPKGKISKEKETSY